MSQFQFLQSEWPEVFDSAAKAESAIHADPRTACFYARRALELVARWAFKFDRALKLPYQDNLSALIHEPTFKQTAGDAVFNKAKVIITLGNRAVHHHQAIPFDDALVAVSELFHVAYWFARTYTRGNAPAASLAFDPNQLPKPATATAKQTIEELRQMAAALQEKDEKLAALLSDKTTLSEELQKLRAEVAAAKKAAEQKPDTHDYSEAQTRDYFIDLLLKEAGWMLDKPHDIEYPVTGMPNQQEKGFVDYVLWGDNGKPLALVEAKRTRRDPKVGQQQAKLYADCLEKEFGQRPVIFYSNGYEHWIWDNHFYPPREIQGFLKKDELELMIQRRQTRQSPVQATINNKIVERYYQTRAIRRVSESFESNHERKTLLVMATGSGKTRTVIALSDLLIRCNWVKRVLFLADRVALVNQAAREFKKHLPDSSPVNLVTEKDTDGRVFASTYPTMMGLINESKDGQRRFGSGHFDLIIIDEAHRSVFQKYRAIFDYFDSLLVGLTATPKDEIDRNTYGLFDLENGVPTDSYSLDEAVRDGFLVPPEAVSVALKFPREGLKYDDMSPEEQEAWDAIDWDEDGEVPKEVDSDAVNKWLFNIDTVDKVLEYLMTRGQKVAGGDRLGKTIIFAKNQAHADFIVKRFDINYPHLRGEFARTITFKTEYAQSLIDDFSIPHKSPHIAVSVDMLDTGIDVPEVLNLVFFKIVRSKTKFWQMVGRGTRLSPDLFGPGQHKKFFYIFDFCQNLEFFKHNPAATEGSANESLGTRLFKSRLELIAVLDQHTKAEAGQSMLAALDLDSDPQSELDVRRWTASLLHREVAAMNPENFVVRPRRRLVEKYAKAEVWHSLAPEALAELAHEVAGLPSELEAEAEEAKRFDMLLLNLQLAVLRSEPAFERLRDQVKQIAGLLEEKSAIPMVHAQLELIEEVQNDAWWQDVTIPMLERVRRRLRDLVKFIEKKQRQPIYTDFIDTLGAETVVEIPGLTAGMDEAKFKAKVQQYLRAHQDHEAIKKLRQNQALTTADLAALQQILAESGVGTPEIVTRVIQESPGLGLFVRSLVGMDREAAKAAFTGFLKDQTFSANQIDFINLVIDYLTQHGVVEPAALYESPFIDLTPTGPDGLFNSKQVDELLAVLEQVRSTALAA